MIGRILFAWWNVASVVLIVTYWDEPIYCAFYASAMFFCNLGYLLVMCLMWHYARCEDREDKEEELDDCSNAPTF